ncbi:MAG: LysM peptidoglycan-binding domain-containing protein [Planctomycetota bacterium]
MSQVEKYGLFAVLLVGGMLLVIAVQGGFSKDTPALPDVIDGTPLLSLPVSAVQKGGEQQPSVVRVRPILPETPFQWNEPPVQYPGERSVPESAALDAGAQPTASMGATPTAGLLPAASVSTPVKSSPAVGGASTHTIAANETLAEIAKRYLGSSSKWPELVTLNPGLDPKRLKIGSVIKLSGSAAASAVPQSTVATPTGVAAKPSAAPVSKSRTHTVKSGDTLGAIAKTYLGSSKRADDLYQANRDVLKNKDDLRIGQVLKIP